MSLLVSMEVGTFCPPRSLEFSRRRVGHYERKMKHLENQKESKRKMKRLGKVDLPQEAFFSLLGSGGK